MFQNVAAGFHRIIRFSCIAALLWGMGGSAQAAEAPPSYPEIVVDDIKHVVTAPARWEKDDWQDFGLATLAVVGTAAIVDRPLRREMLRQHGNNNRFMRDVERIGAEYSLGVLGGFYLAGVAADNDKAVAVAQDGLAASIVASGIITPVLKVTAGRSRPKQNGGYNNFRPFSGSLSFPSGHATQAFAMASVISAHYDNLLVQSAVYGVAGLVGLARTYHDAHYASDVVAGAIIGTLIGHSVVEHNRTLRPGKVALLPEIGPDMVGMRLTGRF